ncbi:hypothetical protein BU15DRAFT_63680 [Melanogaster broomeanus]|nr:hypothetical protein BU15DRAFT_63680 [Melanogaster broomeanus]
MDNWFDKTDQWTRDENTQFRGAQEEGRASIQPTSLRCAIGRRGPSSGLSDLKAYEELGLVLLSSDGEQYNAEGRPIKVTAQELCLTAKLQWTMLTSMVIEMSARHISDIRSENERQHAAALVKGPLLSFLMHDIQQEWSKDEMFESGRMEDDRYPLSSVIRTSTAAISPKTGRNDLNRQGRYSASRKTTEISSIGHYLKSRTVKTIDGTRSCEVH